VERDSENVTHRNGRRCGNAHSSAAEVATDEDSRGFLPERDDALVVGDARIPAPFRRIVRGLLVVGPTRVCLDFVGKDEVRRQCLELRSRDQIFTGGGAMEVCIVDLRRDDRLREGRVFRRIVIHIFAVGGLGIGRRSGAVRSGVQVALLGLPPGGTQGEMIEDCFDRLRMASRVENRHPDFGFRATVLLGGTDRADDFGLKLDGLVVCELLTEHESDPGADLGRIREFDSRASRRELEERRRMSKETRTDANRVTDQNAPSTPTFWAAIDFVEQ